MKRLPEHPRRLQRRSAGREAWRVLLIGVISGTLYLVVYLAQRGMYLNGLLLSFADTLVQGEPASRARLLAQCAAYYGATLALFVLYAWLLALCRRDRLRDARARSLALVFPILFNLALLLGRPYLSTDVLSYIAYGYLGALPDRNPYVQIAADVEQTPLGPQLAASGWQPVYGVAPYGPLWTQCVVAVMRLAGDVPTAILLIKMLVVAASLGCAALIWLILGRVRPTDQLLGTLVYLWNPLVIVEFAAEGHNDALMIVLALASLLLSVSTRPVPALAALMLATLTKYLPLILLPAQLAYFWRTSRHRARLLLLLLLLLAGASLAALLYRPVWGGAEAFQGVLAVARPTVNASTPGALFWALSHSPYRAQAAWLAWGIASTIFGGYLLLASWRVRGVEHLLRACGGIALVYVLVALPRYWPWYATLPFALIALWPHGTYRWMVLVLPLCSRVVAPLDIMAINGFIPRALSMASMAAIGVALPLLTFLLLSAWQWHRQRESTRQEIGVPPLG